MCAIFGIVPHADASACTVLGLHAQQHRGQEAAGILSFDFDRDTFNLKRYGGLVSDRLNSAKVIDTLKGSAAIGHTRYSTAGGSAKCNAQPLYAELSCGRVGIVHNGNFTNARFLRRKLEAEGAIFTTTSDTEVVLHLMARSKAVSVQERLMDALSKLEGAWSLLLLTEDGMYAVRDPKGIRPLVEGSFEGSIVFASETVAFDIIGATYTRDIFPGEVAFVGHDRIRASEGAYGEHRSCLFEYVYFSRPDSIMSHPLHDECAASSVRRKLGQELALEQPCEADLVVPVLGSGLFAALGYAERSGISFEPALIRNHYVGRTFIEPEEGIRNFGVRLKHNANRLVIKGNRVVLIDDSLVRGTTSGKIVRMVREAGASEVHVRISCPPTRFSCFYGIDTPEQEKLLASRHSLFEMARIIGADTLGYLSLDGMYRAVLGKPKSESPIGFCDACWTGEYQTPLTDLLH